MDDLIGRTFSRLTVVARAVNLNHSIRYECLCSCGTLTIAYKSMLVSGRHKSCGCLKRERIVARSATHRMKGTPTYNSWSNMLARCTRPTHPRYENWGGRGIQVCDRWRKFENFLADMGEKPDGKTLDRKDNNGPYCLANCQWSTPAEQAANSRNLKLTADVISDIRHLHATGMTMTAIGKYLGLNRHTVAKALF